MKKESVLVLTLVIFLNFTTVSKSSEILTESKTLKDGIKTAETYWNAQKVSDEVMFRSVTSRLPMIIVFDWSFVNKSDVLIEEATIANIKPDLMNFFEQIKKYENMPKHSLESLNALKDADSYAINIEKGGYPMLGNLLKKGYWSTITRSNLADMNKYKLMNLKYIADVKVQSMGGSVLQRRATINLYRMQADSFDSGWKVLSVSGLYN